MPGEKKGGVILSASTMLGVHRCLQTVNADAGKQLIVINIAVLKSAIRLRENQVFLIYKTFER